MSKKTRIKSRADMAKLYNSKSRYSCHQFQLCCIRNTVGNMRYCISVSKKVDKKAVVRNKVKRQVRTFFDFYNKENSPNLSFDFYFWVRKDFLKNSYHINFSAFKKAFKILVSKAML